MKNGSYIRTEEIRQKQRISSTRNVPKNCLFCGKEFNHKPSRPHKFCSRKCATSSPETRMKMSIASKGKPKSPEVVARKFGRRNTAETRKKMSESAKRRVAEGRHHNYKGGVAGENERIRHSVEYRLWREAVFKRDNWTCVWCGSMSGKGNPVYLEADHIKPFAYYPELRFAIDNGRTLCRPCHLTTDTHSWKKK